MSAFNILPGAHALIVDVDWLIDADFESLMGEFKFLCERTRRLFVRETEKTWDDALIAHPDLEIWSDYVAPIPSNRPIISDFFKRHEDYAWTRTNVLLTQDARKCGGADLVHATSLEEYRSSNAAIRLDRSFHLDGAPLASWEHLLTELPLQNANSLVLVDWHLFEEDRECIRYFDCHELTAPIRNLVDVVSSVGTSNSELHIVICFQSSIRREKGEDGECVVLDPDFFREWKNRGKLEMEIKPDGLIELQRRISKTISLHCHRNCRVELIGLSRPPKKVIHNRPICTEHWIGESDVGWSWFYKNELRQNHVRLEHSYHNLAKDSIISDSSLTKWLNLFLSLEKLWKRSGKYMTCVNSDGEIVGTWSEMNHPLLPKLN